MKRMAIRHWSEQAKRNRNTYIQRCVCIEKCIIRYQHHYHTYIHTVFTHWKSYTHSHIQRSNALTHIMHRYHTHILKHAFHVMAVHSLVVCVCVCICVYVLYVYVYVFVYLYVYIYVRMYVYVWKYVYVCIWYVYVYVCICICMYMYMNSSRGPIRVIS